MHAVIFADRLGYELWPLTEVRPVCMVPVANKPVLQLTLEELQRLGIRRATVICSNRTGQIAAFFGNGQALDMRLDYVDTSAPCCVEYGLELAKLTRNDDWIALRGDMVRPFGFLEEALKRGKAAGASSIFSALGICLRGDYGRPTCDLRWSTMLAEGTIDPLNLLSLSAYHRCNMKALDGDLPGFSFPGRPAVNHLAVNQQSVVLAPFPDRRTLIGRNCLIERNVLLEAGAIIGDGSIIDNGAIIRESIVLPGSYVGAMEIEYSIVDGSRIYHCYDNTTADLSGSSLAGLNTKNWSAEFSMA